MTLGLLTEEANIRTSFTQSSLSRFLIGRMSSSLSAYSASSEMRTARKTRPKEPAQPPQTSSRQSPSLLRTVSVMVAAAGSHPATECNTAGALRATARGQPLPMSVRFLKSFSLLTPGTCCTITVVRISPFQK